MEDITRKGKEIYEKLLPSILPHYKDQYIVILTDNGEYWIDSNLTKALQQARAKYPTKKFFMGKIGAKEGSLAQFS